MLGEPWSNLCILHRVVEILELKALRLYVLSSRTCAVDSVHCVLPER